MNLDEVVGFDWDEANVLKNWEKHKVKHTEAEEIFENKPRIVSKDYKHSLREARYQILGVTNEKRELSVIFTFRGRKVRVISARDMNRKESAKYEEAT